MNKDNSAESKILSEYFSELTQSDEFLALDKAAQLLHEAEAALLNDTVEVIEPTLEDVASQEVETVSEDESLEARLPQRFQTLFFELAGLRLAIPLIELGGIHRIEKIKPLPGHAKWMMGVLLKGEEKFQVIDSALWIMPEKYNEQMRKNLDYKFAVQLGKTHFVLACENVKKTEEIDKANVKWRTQAVKRPWLAGTVKDKMCSLVDAQKLVEMLSLA